MGKNSDLGRAVLSESIGFQVVNERVRSRALADRTLQVPFKTKSISDLDAFTTMYRIALFVQNIYSTQLSHGLPSKVRKLMQPGHRPPGWSLPAQLASALDHWPLCRSVRARSNREASLLASLDRSRSILLLLITGFDKLTL